MLQGSPLSRDVQRCVTCQQLREGACHDRFFFLCPLRHRVVDISVPGQAKGFKGVRAAGASGSESWRRFLQVPIAPEDHAELEAALLGDVRGAKQNMQVVQKPNRSHLQLEDHTHMSVFMPSDCSMRRKELLLV